MKARALLDGIRITLPLSSILCEYSLIISGLGPPVERGSAIPVSQMRKRDTGSAALFGCTQKGRAEYRIEPKLRIAVWNSEQQTILSPAVFTE